MMKKFNNGLIGILLVMVSLSVFGQPYTVYKDSDSYVCINSAKKELKRGTSASEVIQFAVDLSEQEGKEEVIIGKGFFKLDKPVQISGKVWIHGKRRGTELQLKKPNQIGVEIVDAASVKVSEVTFTGGDNGNSLAGIRIANSKDCQINSVIFLGFAGSGLAVSGASQGITVDRCTFVDNAKSHILMKGVTGNKEQPIVVSNGMFFRGGYGILTRKGEVQSKGLESINNAFTYLKGASIDTDFDYVTITGNRVFWGESDGMRMKGKGLNFSGNTYCWMRGHGLVLDGATDGEVIGNNITDLGARYHDGMRKCGVYLCNSAGISISGNSIWNFGDQGHMEYAIYEATSCKNNTITFNTGWFHAYPNAFESKGEGTRLENNTSNQGQYRGDFWDPTQKYGYPMEKYIKSLYLDGNCSPETVADPDAAVPQGKLLIESKTLFGVVVSKIEGAIKQFGWTGNDTQIWQLEEAADGYYTIANVGSGEFIQAVANKTNSPVSLVKSDKKRKDAVQLWRPVSVGNGYFKLENKMSGKVLTAPYRGNLDWGVNKVVYRGQELTVSDYNSSEGQMWTFTNPMPAYTYDQVGK